jgi:hypothetical protein
MKHHLWLAGVLVLAASSSASAQRAASSPADVPAERTRASTAARVLFVNAVREGETCVAPTLWTRTCAEVPSGRALTTLHAVELQVINRRFFTDYVVEITAKTQLEGAGIRGLEEAASLTLSEPSLIPPPSKGPLTALEPRTATSILAALLAEAEAGSQAALLQADEAVIDAQLRSFRTTVRMLAGDLERLLGTSSQPSAATTSAPTISGVRAMLAATLAEATTGRFAQAPYRDEEDFRRLNSRVRDRLAVLRNLQQVVTDSRLPDETSDAIDELARIRKNVAIFAANRVAAADAVAMYDGLRESAGTRVALRREQLRAMFRAQLKPAQGDPVLDDAELNALVGAYLEFLSRRGFSVANDSVRRLKSELAAMEGRAAERRTQLATIGTDTEVLADQVRLALPREAAAVNVALGSLLTRMNEIYDQSQSSARLTKIIDLSGYSANTFGYAVRRIERYVRYTVTAAPTAHVGGGLRTPTPPSPAVSDAKPAPTASAAAAPGKTAAPAAVPATPEPNEPPVAPVEGEIVATGTFEVHRMDRAAVVAGFAFSSLKRREFGAQQKPATGSRPAGLYPITTSESTGQPHVLLGINYYLHPRDTYPEADTSLSHFGVMAGLSLNELHNYFLGGLWEPKLGFNLGAGLHFGKAKELQEPYRSGDPLPDTTVPTFEKRVIGVYLQAGLDVDIFRKVFGKATGVGTAATVKPVRVGR